MSGMDWPEAAEKARGKVVESVEREQGGGWVMKFTDGTRVPFRFVADGMGISIGPPAP